MKGASSSSSPVIPENSTGRIRAVEEHEPTASYLSYTAGLVLAIVATRPLM
jgi:hypothetical protein